jgi:hypothetical protein
MTMRTYSLPSKVIAMLTAVGLVGLGCTGAEDPDPGADPGSREVSLEVSTNVEDENGARSMARMGTDTATLDELQKPRTLVIDGAESSDLARVRSASEIVVPLNTGETATLARHEDRLELVSFTGEDDGAGDLPRGAVEAVRMLDEGIEVFLTGSTGDEPDTIVRVSGIEDLDAERSALVTSLALDTILVSLEDTEQIPPPVAIAMIAAALGAFYMAICGALMWECANKCEYWTGWETDCGDFHVKTTPFSIDVNMDAGCRCY